MVLLYCIGTIVKKLSDVSDSIFKQKIKFNLILVDNNSKKIFSEKIINWLKKNKIKINYINNKKNFIIIL